MEAIHIDKSSAEAVEAYLEYRRIVGDDDGGRLFSEAEFEAYKQKVLPLRTHNRLYVSFGIPGSIDCKLIGPETLCFCSHRYKQHQTDFECLPEQHPVRLPCRVQRCGCLSYQYVPRCGSQAARCCCKHTPSQHHTHSPHPCSTCDTCPEFRCPMTCVCGQPAHAHVTLVESREEREARGRPVGRAVAYAAMGGLSGFSSLAEGYVRLDPSGLGLTEQDTNTSGGEQLKCAEKNHLQDGLRNKKTKQDATSRNPGEPQIKITGKAFKK